MVERTVDLWKYLPEFLKQYRELNALFDAEKPYFQALVHNQLGEMKNFFIETADGMGLSRFERVLKIYPNPDDTLEIRRKNILVHWYSNDICTLLTLKNRLALLQGNDNIQFSWDEDDPLLLHVVTRLEEKGQVDTMNQILETMLPANVAYESTNYIEFNKEITPFVAVALTGTFTLFHTTDFNENVDISGNAFVGMANTYTEIISTN